MTQSQPIARALVSVSDKTGLDGLADILSRHGVEVLSTGGTAKALRKAGADVVDVSEHTGFPEMMDGRIKTLHPKIHGGLLAVRDNERHAKAMKDHGIAPIDLVVVNLYPFEKTVDSGAEAAEIIENIDIGGPSMVRSAAKNHAFVTIITDPADYEALAKEMQAHDGGTSPAFRRRMAARAFRRTADYDTAIAGWFAGGTGGGDSLPETLALSGRRVMDLRYGENPHQKAAFYASGPARPGVGSADLLQGKALSYNNLNDTNAAYELVAEFDPATPAVAIIKHANPCGVGTGKTFAGAYEKALRCDPVSAFGGIVALNGELDGETAAKIAEVFTEVIIAPTVSDEARDILSKKKNLRLLAAGALPDPREDGLDLRSIAGGLLVQGRDTGRILGPELKTVTKRKPTERERKDLLFAFRVAKHVKSNAIVYAREGATVGIGAGQMSRLDSSRIAARKAKEAADAAGFSESLARGSVVASDAFFPFADGMLAAVDAGATAVIQPGGSIRDEEVIKAADEAGIAMVLTGMRHFRH